MISKIERMHDTSIFRIDSENSKKACKHIMQINTSNKILLGATQGIGNAILTTPLIQALTSMNLKVDILKEGFVRGAEKIFEGMPNVKVLGEDEIGGRIYLLGLQTLWPYPGLEKYVAQVRCAGNIFNMWKEGIAAHEVEVNMSLAYSLKYEGEVPPLYCHYRNYNSNYPSKAVGIHVCRKYSHQFYANRRLCNPFTIAEYLKSEGYHVVILGAEGSVSSQEMEEFPMFEYKLGLSLPDIAGVIKSLDCVVNEDSGIMHVTAAMDTPQVTAFGPTSWLKNRAWSEKAMLIRKDIPCHPCQYTLKQNECFDNFCMDIDPSYIVQCVKHMVGSFPK